MAMGMTAPAFFFLKNGISGFISSDLKPVVVCEISDCMLRLPVKSTALVWRLKEPLRSTATPGVWKVIRCVERIPLRILTGPLRDDRTSDESEAAVELEDSPAESGSVVGALFPWAR